MKCEDVLDILRSPGGTPRAREEAVEHLASCAECQVAAQAVAALRFDGARAIRVPTDNAMRHAIAAAVRSAQLSRPQRRASPRFAVAVGVSLAAGIAIGMLVLAPMLRAPVAITVPEVTIALNEVREVRVAVNSPEAITAAAIHVVLNGAIGLQGFEARELRWSVDLERGTNELKLPIVASGVDGGQIVVELEHGDKRRTFVVDVRTSATAPVPTARVLNSRKPSAEPAPLTVPPTLSGLMAAVTENF